MMSMGGAASGSGGTISAWGGTSGGGVTGGGGAASGGATASGGAPGGPTTYTVYVAQLGDRYTPSTITIRVGDTVHWVWVGNGHSVTSGVNGIADGIFCAPNDSACSPGVTFDTGFTYDHTFTSTGALPYFCTQHWVDGMTGTVTVQ